MIKLSDAQMAIVHAPLGEPVRVLAAAGSGKTRVLTERVRRILSETKRDGVIALTFTNKAAEEMLLRLDEVDGLDERCWIATVHSVAKRILDQYGHTVGLPPELHIYERDQDRRTVFLESLKSAGVDADTLLGIAADANQRQRDAQIHAYMSRFSELKRSMATAVDEAAMEDADVDVDFRCVYQAYQEALLQSGGIDFDDILVYAHRILLEQPWCGDIYRAKFKHLCVDEAQDLNKAQYEFIKALCGDAIKSVLMVGDPNQMIYGFNGSSNEFLRIRFVEDFAPTTFELTENYRSSQAVVEKANGLLRTSQLVAVYPIQGVAQCVALDDEAAEAAWIAEKIDELLSMGEHEEIEGPISLDKMVVIARNRFVFGPIQSALHEREVPYSLNKGEQQVEPSSVVGRVLDLAIRLKLNSRDWVHGERLCSLLGIAGCSDWGDPDLLVRLAEAVAQDVPMRDIQVELLEWISELDLDAPAMVKLFEHFEAALSDVGKSSSDADGELERSIRELQALRDCWMTFRQRGLGESLLAFRNAMALGQVATGQSLDGVTLSTVHTMKGLERDIVFLAGMCDGVFPDYRASTPKALNEERNNAFVAVTRARRWLFVSYPRRRMMPWGDMKGQQASRFLAEMDMTGE